MVHVVSLHRKIRMHSSRMRTARSLPYREGGLSLGGLCPVGSLSRGVQRRGLCPEVGLSPRGSLPGGGVSMQGVSVQGSLCPGGSVSVQGEGVSRYDQND